MENTGAAFLRLVDIMDELRVKCPWDKKQTIHTLRTLTIEETYELADAIISEDWPNLKEELGDILLHIVFYARIATEKEKFTLEEVLHSICDKLIVRHPHIYPPVTADGNLLPVVSDEDVKKNWETIKMKQGKKSVLGGVPGSLPAVVKATRIQEKSAQVGFEWDNRDDVWKKVEEEIAELKEAIAEQDQNHIEEEFGDVMFSLINYARFLQVDAEIALEKVNRKFIQRFTQMESAAAEQGNSLAQMSLQEMDELWNHIKKENSNH
jgi:MazG family protein